MALGRPREPFLFPLSHTFTTSWDIFHPLCSYIVMLVVTDTFSYFVTVLFLTFLCLGSVVGQHASALTSPGALTSF